uniref:Uncharacterized protein n=1 Tax=Tanacetum cinerariifolium TaxID=118510 RepID=A0A6L2KRM7_TANCI|nr:hypothetical protein [Tanacetum cinerariifolium]
MTPPSTHVDTTPIPIVSPTIPPSPDYTPASPDYTPASPDYSPVSDTESDLFKDPSSDHIPPLPATSPFLSSIDDSSDNDIPDTPPSLPMIHHSLRLPFLPRDHLQHLLHFNVESWFLHLWLLWVFSLDHSCEPCVPMDSFSYCCKFRVVYHVQDRRRSRLKMGSDLILRRSVICLDYVLGERDSSSSSSSETSSDSSADVLSDSASSRSSSDHSLLAPSSGMRPSHHLCSLIESIHRSSAIISARPSHDSSPASPGQYQLEWIG